MKKGIITDIDWAYIGATLAQGDDHDQVAFFKSFIKECKSWGTNYQVEKQFAYINGKLTSDEIDALSMITYKDNDNE